MAKKFELRVWHVIVIVVALFLLDRVDLMSTAPIGSGEFECRVSAVGPYCGEYDVVHDIWIKQASHTQCCGEISCCTAANVGEGKTTTPTGETFTAPVASTTSSPQVDAEESIIEEGQKIIPDWLKNKNVLIGIACVAVFIFGIAIFKMARGY